MKLLLPAECCAILRCSKSTFYGLLERGELIGHRCPGWRVKVEDLHAYLQKTRREPETPRKRNSDRRPRLKHLKI